MSLELSLSCQAHTESLTTIPWSLGHHREHPKWLKLVGVLQRRGHTEHYQLAKRETLSHRWSLGKQFQVSLGAGHHTEHARLISSKEWITPSLNSFSKLFDQFSVSLVSMYIEAAVAAAFISRKSGAAHTASVGCYKHTL